MVSVNTVENAKMAARDKQQVEGKMSAGSAGRRTSLRALHGITRCIRLCVHAGHCERGKLIIGAFNADGLVACKRVFVTCIRLAV